MERLAQYLTSGIRFTRKIFAIERLPEAAPQVAHRGERPSIRKLLFAVEPLPRDPPLPSRARFELAKSLFAPEALPRDPPGPPRRRSHWLRWLFAPERIDQK